MGLSTLAGGSFHIEYLYLRNCSSITGECSNNNEIYINISNIYVDTGIGNIAKAFPKLKVLDMNGCSRVGEFGGHALTSIGASCSQLR